MAGGEGSQKIMYEPQVWLLRAGVQANVEIVFHPKLQAHGRGSGESVDSESQSEVTKELPWL